MSYELPPIAQGTPEQQLTALRDYLVRLAQSLDKEAGGSAIIIAPNEKAASAQKETLKGVRDQAASLKALIIKNANEIHQYVDRKEETYNSSFVAKSDFGTFEESLTSRIETTARGTIENYQYMDRTLNLVDDILSLEEYRSTLEGQIRRGMIEDPVTHEVHLGIAISEHLSFTGNTTTSNGETYYELSPGQTLGLYTSTGWQFWINGTLRGYFSSQDSMLHVSNIVVENRLQLGADWEIVISNGFGLRYIGG